MQVFLGITNVLLILNAIILIVSVLMQEGSRQGLGVIAGGAETFFGKTKGRSYEGKLEMITKISVATFMLLAIIMTAVNARGIDSTTVEPADLSAAPGVADLLESRKIAEQASELDLTIPAEEAADELAATVEDATAETEAAAEGAAADVAETADELAATVEDAATETETAVEGAAADVVETTDEAAETVEDAVEVEPAA